MVSPNLPQTSSLLFQSNTCVKLKLHGNNPSFSPFAKGYCFYFFYPFAEGQRLLLLFFALSPFRRRPRIIDFIFCPFALLPFRPCRRPKIIAFIFCPFALSPLPKAKRFLFAFCFQPLTLLLFALFPFCFRVFRGQ